MKKLQKNIQINYNIHQAKKGKRIYTGQVITLQILYT
jgi:hypothetical protein